MDLSWGTSTAVVAPGENVQGSEAWLKWRGKGLGSSDAAVLLGCSPWKNIQQLLDEKLGLWKPTFGAQQMAAMERGKELEPKIRQWFEHTVNAPFPDGIATDPVHEFMRASFDGENREYKNRDGSVGAICEIKAPNAKDHALAGLEEVPEKYVPQVQWLMKVGNLPYAYYVSYGTDGKYHVVEMPADPVMQAELTRRALIFWQHVLTKSPIVEWEKWERPLSAPLALTIDLLLSAADGAAAVSTLAQENSVSKVIQETAPTIDEQEVEALVAQALVAQEEAKAAEAKFEALKEKIKKIAGSAEEVRRGEAVFGFNTRKGAVDYTVIPELIGLDLEQFRKPPIKVFYFKRK